MRVCVWTSLSHTHIPFFSCSYSLHPLFFYLPSTYMQPSTSQQYCACVWLCVFALCMMWRQWRAVFHSWIKPGQRPRGLQVNVAYFKRLFLHGHSVSNAHAEESQQGKSLRIWFTHLFIFSKKTLCVFKISLQFVGMLSFLFSDLSLLLLFIFFSVLVSVFFYFLLVYLIYYSLY